MSKTPTVHSSIFALALACLVISFSSMTLSAKDLPAPVYAKCDALTIGSPRWSACLKNENGAASDQKLFYAGYWLAKTGAFERALVHLGKVSSKNERVLTYTGFALRKLGRLNEAMAAYHQALTLKPDYVVARAYIGEALVTQGDLDGARAQLKSIASICGTSCAEYAELAAHINTHNHLHD